MAAIKERLDAATVPLFDCSRAEVDDSTRQLLVQLSGQLSQLCTVLAAVTSGAGVITQIGLDELKCRQNVPGLVLLNTQAVGWFVSVGLLPEQAGADCGGTSSNPFPARKMEKMESSR